VFKSLAVLGFRGGFLPCNVRFGHFERINWLERKGHREFVRADPSERLREPACGMLAPKRCKHGTGGGREIDGLV
jgi:hypothetical protein